MTPDPSMLNALWATLEDSPARSLVRTTQLGVACGDGPLLLGIGRTGTRQLLVPVSARVTVKELLDGRAVLVRRQVLEDEDFYGVFVVLELSDVNQVDMFSTLCAEAVSRVAAAPDRALASVNRVLGDWRALLSGDRRTLGPTQLAGLFGELWVLRELLRRDAGAGASWTGPSGSAQDFHHRSRSLEVKSTTATEGRTVRIHGLGQLDSGGELILVWLRLRTDRGITLPDLVEELSSLTADERGLVDGLGLLGYSQEDRESYALRTFEVVESAAYRVCAGFPRITAHGLVGDAAEAGINRVEYDLDLTAAPAEMRRHTTDPFDAFLRPA